MDVVEEKVHPLADIHVGKLAAAHEGVDDGGVLGGIMVSAEEIPLSSYGQWPHAVFNGIVVNLVPAIGDIP